MKKKYFTNRKFTPEEYKVYVKNNNKIATAKDSLIGELRKTNNTLSIQLADVQVTTPLFLYFLIYSQMNITFELIRNKA